MAYLIHLRPASDVRVWRVLSDLDEPSAAIQQAVAYLRGYLGEPDVPMTRRFEPADYAPLGEREFAPAHDLYAGTETP